MKVHTVKVVRVTKTEFELEDGRVYDHPVELEETPALEEFQLVYDEWVKKFQEMFGSDDGKTDKSQSTKGRIGKSLSRLLGHWNIDLLYRRMQDKAEASRTFLAFVEPAYTSQRCNSCGAIDKKSRNGEVFRCTSCGHADDADHNASLNILQRFLDGEFTVSRCAQRM